MTTQSHPWKQTLERQAKALQAFTETHRLTTLTRVKLEESVVLGCYALRRLVNGFLLSESCCHQSLSMTVFPRRPQSVPLLGDEPLPTRYNLDAGRVAPHDLMFLCHQVLQNCVFEPWLNTDHRLTGIYITSDHQHKIALYGVSLSALSDRFLHLSTNTTQTE